MKIIKNDIVIATHNLFLEHLKTVNGFPFHVIVSIALSYTLTYSTNHIWGQ